MGYYLNLVARSRPMNSCTLVGFVRSGSFSAFCSEKIFVVPCLLPDFVDSQPTVQDKPATRMIPAILRTKIDIFHKPPRCQSAKSVQMFRKNREAEDFITVLAEKVHRARRVSKENGELTKSAENDSKTLQ